MLLLNHFRRSLIFRNKMLPPLGLMVLFVCLADAFVSYLTPILITDWGYSNTQMGFILAFSSVAGAFFDFILSRLIKNTNYVRLFLILFALCFAYPLIIWNSHTIFLLLVSMAVWGLYYDVLNFAIYDFVGNQAKKDEHSAYSGIISIFRTLGYFIGPVIAGLLISQTESSAPLIMIYIFLVISLIFYIISLSFIPKDHLSQTNSLRTKINLSFLREASLWRQVGHIIFPMLMFTLLLNLTDSFYWTIGPLFFDSYPEVSNFSGLFVAVSTIPIIFTGWFAEPITKRFGKKKTAFYSTLLSAIFLLSFLFLKNPILIILFTFVSSTLSSFAWPALDGAFLDYITESRKYEREIEGLSDFFCNLGYILGPIFAGLISDLIGIIPTFGFLGLLNIAASIIFIAFTPKKIYVRLPLNPQS